MINRHDDTAGSKIVISFFPLRYLLALVACSAVTQHNLLYETFCPIHALFHPTVVLSAAFYALVKIFK